MSSGRPNAGIAGSGERLWACVCAAARQSFNSDHSSVNHQRPTIRDRKSQVPPAFTLIELLVVISIMAVLVALLMPTLSRVRRQARAVACRANLGQWGILHATYAAENDGYLPCWDPDRWTEYNPADPWWVWARWVGGSGRPLAKGVEPGTPDSASFTAVKGILLCPMASKPGYAVLGSRDWRGGTFLAWTACSGLCTEWPSWNTSYGPNEQAHSWPKNFQDPIDYWRLMWMTNAVRNASTVPVFMDDMVAGVPPFDDKMMPPESDAIPTRASTRASDHVCINRHEGGINSLFLELWALKWHPEYNTAGPWTQRGGVRAEDWPQWMRRFKD
jgi:prepilin-type N-terminal cleavage/methylation domain-containing protein